LASAPDNYKVVHPECKDKDTDKLKPFQKHNISMKFKYCWWLPST